MNIYFDVSFISLLKGSLTGISRSVISIIKELALNHPTVAITGISFNCKTGYELLAYSDIVNKTRHLLDYDGLEISATNMSKSTIENGAILAFMGEEWMFDAVPQRIEEIRRVCNVKVVHLIHDLVPFFMPELYWDGFCEKYIKSLNDMCHLADHVFVNSESTRKDLIEHVPCARDKDITKIVLGDVFAKESVGPVQWVDKFDNSFLLCVGTIQPRKNHYVLLQVWRRLLIEYEESCPHLVIVGSIGWNVDNLISYIKENPKLSNKITILGDVSESVLSYLYKHSKFTLYPSLYEGWGLPIRESLSYGKFCIASRSSSMPEAGGDLCAYFDPNDSGELYQLINKYYFDDSALEDVEKKIRVEFFENTWADTAKQFLNKLIKNA
jgi:glycosyltransferase involved in cell wall biosynthesis